MTIDWTHFTPQAAVAGGVLIGVAAAAFVLFNGRIAGISGILGGLLRPARGDVGWRVAFLAGLIAAPLVYGLFAALPEATVDGRSMPAPGHWRRPACWSGLVRAMPRAAPAAMVSAAFHACRPVRLSQRLHSWSPASSLSISCATSCIE
jgi:uncharacterized membrane protein YedE/YeeE